MMRPLELSVLALLLGAASTGVLDAQEPEAREPHGLALRPPASAWTGACRTGDPMPVLAPEPPAGMPRLEVVSPEPMPNPCTVEPAPLRAPVLSDLPAFRERFLASLPPGLPTEPLHVLVRVRTGPEGDIRQAEVESPSAAPAFDRAVLEALRRSSLHASWAGRTGDDGLRLSIEFDGGAVHLRAR